MTPVISIVGGLLTSWLDRRGRVKEAETKATIENAGKVIDTAGWKDEFVVLIWSIPAIMAFVPGMNEHVTAGFVNLREAPEWYILGWVGISMAVYGIKPATKQILKWRKDKQ